MVKKRVTLITGRTTKQGEAIHLKETRQFQDEVSIVQMNAADIQALGLQEGDRVRLSTPYGSTSTGFKRTDVPAGLVFIPFGKLINRIIGNDTQGTGMPDFKGIQVEVQRDGADNGK